MIAYIIKSGLMLSLFSLFFILVMKRTTFFRFNRIMLMTGCFICILPLLFSVLCFCPDNKSRSFRDLDEMALFKGENPGAFSKWVNEQLAFSEITKTAAAEGRLIASFTIDRRGELVNPRIVRGLSDNVDREVLRILLELLNRRKSRSSGRTRRSRLGDCRGLARTLDAELAAGTDRHAARTRDLERLALGHGRRRRSGLFRRRSGWCRSRCRRWLHLLNQVCALAFCCFSKTASAVLLFKLLWSILQQKSYKDLKSPFSFLSLYHLILFLFFPVHHFSADVFEFIICRTKR